MPERSHRLSRRDFLKFSAGAVAGVAFKTLFDWGLESPITPDLFGATDAEPGYPGWLERRNPDRPVFINAGDKGHKEYLVYMATHDKSLVRTHARAFHDLFFNEPKKRIGLRESFWKHIEIAYGELKFTNAHLDDVVHMALYSFASINSNFFTVGDVWNNFRQWDMYHPQRDTAYIDIQQYKKNVPSVFPEDPSTGVDKMMHFAGFAFLTYQYWYAKTHGLPDADRIPHFASLISGIADEPVLQSNLFSMLGDIAWEADETGNWISEMKSKKKWLSPKKGLFEYPGVVADTRASYMGMRFVMPFCKPTLTIEEVETACASLDDPDSLWPAIPAEMPAVLPPVSVK